MNGVPVLGAGAMPQDLQVAPFVIPIEGYEMVVQDEHRNEVVHPVKFAQVDIIFGPQGQGIKVRYFALGLDGSVIAGGKVRRTTLT